MKLKKKVLHPQLSVTFTIIFGMFSLYKVAFQSQFSIKYLFYIDEIAMFIFYNRSNLQILFQLASCVHILESILAIYLAVIYHYKFKEIILWALQTLIIGYPSLRLLILQIREN
jgi:hypothetical protein